ncbi:MAG: nitroreductase [Clostridiales bacterium]|jgi:nitroreductase|nr:nitroreductase [Eubacteriales bacterium]MDH7566581.1 nitroreductase [Clostridiales bacterium]
MMNVIEALQARHSTRAYKPDPVDRETIRKILEAANHAPSWANTQPWEVFVASGEPLERLRQRNLENFRNGVPPEPDQPTPQHWPEAHQKRTGAMAAAHQAILGIKREDKDARKIMTENNLRFFGAPVVIFLCMDRTLDPWSLYDLGSFSQSIMLAAQHYGLNTIPAIMMSVYPKLIREELNIPDNLKVVFSIALGYGDPESIQNKLITTRRPLDEFVRMAGI